jgi:hypothetical protein
MAPTAFARSHSGSEADEADDRQTSRAGIHSRDQRANPSIGPEKTGVSAVRVPSGIASARR